MKDVLYLFFAHVILYSALTYATSHILMYLFLLLLGNWPSSYSRSFSLLTISSSLMTRWKPYYKSLYEVYVERGDFSRSGG